MFSGDQTRICLIRDVDLEPYTTLHGGEQGTVVASEFENGGWTWIEVQMDTYHEGLTMWRNVAHIADPDLTAVQVIKKKKPYFSSAERSHLAIVATLALFAAVGFTAVLLPLRMASAIITVEDPLGRYAPSWWASHLAYEQWREQWLASKSYPTKTGRQCGDF